MDNIYQEINFINKNFVSWKFDLFFLFFFFFLTFFLKKKIFFFFFFRKKKKKFFFCFVFFLFFFVFCLFLCNFATNKNLKKNINLISKKQNKRIHTNDSFFFNYHSFSSIQDDGIKGLNFFVVVCIRQIFLAIHFFFLNLKPK